MNIPSSEYVILLSHDAADFVGRCDTGRWVYRMLKCAALTQAWNVKFAPHAMENVHLHLVAALPNAPFLERLLMFVFKDARLNQWRVSWTCPNCRDLARRQVCGRAPPFGRRLPQKTPT